MKKFLMKLSTDDTLQAFAYPLSEREDQNYEMMANLIGNNCFLLENVRSQRMFDKLGMEDIVMLIDDMGKLKENRLNQIASELFSGNMFGEGSIDGNVLFVKEIETKDGFSYDGLAESELLKLKTVLENIW